MSLRGAEDEPPRPRPRPAAATAAVLADRMGGLLLHPASAPLLHVDHGHRAPEPTPMDTGVGGLNTEEQRDLMDKKWAKVYESVSVAKGDKRVVKPDLKSQGWKEDWKWLEKGSIAHLKKVDLAKEVKRELKQKHEQAEARADALARARAQNPLQQLVQDMFGGGSEERTAPADSSDDEAPLSLRMARRPWAAADGRGRFQQTTKPVYKEAYYLQWFDEDAWEELPQGINAMHRFYKLDRAALLDPTT